MRISERDARVALEATARLCDSLTDDLRQYGPDSRLSGALVEAKQVRESLSRKVGEG